MRGLSRHGFVLRGAGFGIAGIPVQNLALSAVSNVAMARASSLFNVTRQIWSAVGVAGLSSYLTSRATMRGAGIMLQARSGTGAAGACASATPAQLSLVRACLTRLVTAEAQMQEIVDFIVRQEQKWQPGRRTMGPFIHQSYKQRRS